MLRYLIPTVCFLFVGYSLFGQVPTTAVIQKTSPNASESRNQKMCENQDAGVRLFVNVDKDDPSIIYSATPSIISNIEILPEPIYLCYDDEFEIDHQQGSEDLSGDSNQSTRGGIGYAFYNCRPTVSGPMLDDILDDCILTISPDTPLVFVNGFTGDVIFENRENFGNGITIPDSLNNGEPIQLWFAPITFDDKTNSNKAIYEDGLNSCVNVNIDEAFSVVYLNPIEIQVSTTDCGGTLTVTGGFAEFNNGSGTYPNVQITHSTSGADAIISGVVRHGESVDFTVSEPGSYIITISDSEGCPSETTVPIICPVSSNNSLEIFSDCPTANPFEQEPFCVDFKVNNFSRIQSFQFRLDWDKSVVEYDNHEVDIALTTEIGNIEVGATKAIDEGQLSFLWFTNNFSEGATLDNGTSLVAVCFQSLRAGDPNFEILDLPGAPDFSPIEITTVDNDQLSLAPNFCPTFEVAGNLPPNTLQVGTIITNPCIGDNNGKIAFNIAGGTPPFTIDLGVGNPTNDPAPITVSGRDTILENLPAGEYEYTIFDADNTASALSAFSSPIIVDPTSLAINFEDPIDPLCVGENTGQLEAEIRENGATVTNLDDYSFQWSNLATGEILDNTESILANIGAGDYEVTITNPNGCTKVDDEDLIDPPILRINNITSTPATCSGSFNGSLSANANGGTGDLSYEWDIDPSINEPNLANIDVGEYQLTVMDENGCSVSASQSVTSDALITINLSGDSISCFNANDGVLVAARGMTSGFPTDAQYTFNWMDENGNDIPFSGTPSGVNTQIEDLSPGTFTVMLTASSVSDPSVAACFSSETVTIGQPDSLMIAAIIDPTTNCRNPDGRIELDVSGGTSAYTYDWTFTDSMITDPGNVNLVSQLPPDSVQIIVTDANDCEATLDTIITSPMPPIVNEFLDNSLPCADDTEGTLQIIAAPGEADITSYRWSHNASVTGNFAGNLGPDTFIVTVIDANFCETIDTAIISAPPPIEITRLDTLQEPCFGEANGGLEIAFTGGTPGYDFNWLDENDEVVATNNSQIIDVVAGTYRIVGEDANGCDFPQNTLVLPSLPEIEVTVDPSRIRGTSCFDNGLNPRDGEAFIQVNYADGRNGEFDIFWPNRPPDLGVTESLGDSLGSGTIQVLIQETIGICSVKDSVTIPSPTEVELDPLNTSFKDVTCNDGNDGTITVAAMGGTSPYAYAWDYEMSTESTLRDLPQGSYTVTITDANDCLAEDNFEIIEPDPLILDLDFDDNKTRDVVCFGDENGQITVVASGGNVSDGSVSYTWLPDVSNGPIATDLRPDVSYSVTATDSEGCTAEVNYEVRQPTPILYNIGPNDDIQCNGGVTTIVADPLSFSGGNGGDYLFSIDNSPAQTLDKVIQVRAGEHTISVYDSGGCQQDSTINVPEPEAISIEFPIAELDGRNLIAEVELGGEIALSPDIFSPLPIADLNWSSSNPADSAFFCNDIAFCDNPIVNPLDNTTYTLRITDINGCEAQQSLLLEVDKNRNVFIPNAFAPNAQGFDLNETFKIYSGVGVEMIEFARVFDRWGALVADLSDQLPSSSGIEVWDGKINGQRAPQGVYVYIFSIRFVDDTTLLYRGDVTVLR